MKQIYLRTKRGWRKITGKLANTCDECGAELLISPSNIIYCNKLHKGKKAT